MTVNILGTDYTVEIKEREEDDLLDEADGYCDKTTKKIVVAEKDDESDLEDYGVYLKKITRHEIIHAFMYESGIAENYEHPHRFGQEETMVDWFAIQFPKILKVFKECDCI